MNIRIVTFLIAIIIVFIGLAHLVPARAQEIMINGTPASEHQVAQDAARDYVKPDAQVHDNTPTVAPTAQPTQVPAPEIKPTNSPVSEAITPKPINPCQQ